MTDYTVAISQIGAGDIDRVGGKGANLGELMSAGFAVPPGFCVTTRAYDEFVAPAIDEVDQVLAGVARDDHQGLSAAATKVRAVLADLPMPPPVERAITEAWRALGSEQPVAVRSSATAEDLPTASFAGQQDTFLNVMGIDDLIEKVQACWISLFTDRAVLYRVNQGVDHTSVSLSVIVQQMVPSSVSGILFTADPVSGNREIVSIDAGFGLGEALVSGVVTADLFQVDKRTQRIVERRIAPKRLAIEPLPGGGTHRIELDASSNLKPTLTDRWVRRLADVGVRIERHFGAPQDIEWAIADDQLFIVQSRPITTLFPVPQLSGSDPGLHAYISVSHFQVMTDPMPPLAISVLRTIMPFDHPGGAIESRTITHAGGRLYLDVTPALRSRILRRMLPRALSIADERFSVALAQLVSRPGVWDGRPIRLRRTAPVLVPILRRALRTLFRGETEGASKEALQIIEHEVAATRSRLSGPETVEGRLAVLLETMRHAFEPITRWAPAAMAGVLASRLVGLVVDDSDDLNAAQRGLTGNVATDMNLEVGDLADTARRFPELVEVLERTEMGGAERLVEARSMPGGERFLSEWNAFLDRYGARGPSEIDLSKPRWVEDPTSLLQMVLNNLTHVESGSHRRHFDELHRDGTAAARRLAEEASSGSLGWIKGRVVRRLLRVSRDLSPMREHHKYFVIRLLADMKPILLEAGEDLESRGDLEAASDVWFLTMPELIAHYGIEGRPDHDLRSRVDERKQAHRHHADLNPPRVMTSDGEIPVAQLDVDAPPNAFVGSAVSAGVVEGTARVITDPSSQQLKPGEILIAPFTDPGWTPLFVNAAGLVTEVGGLMTHGSVVAREYGIPAVVGVDGATTRMSTGQRVRVNGDAGYVEVLDHDSP